MSNIKELSDKKVLSEAKRYQAQWQKNHLDGYALMMAKYYNDELMSRRKEKINKLRAEPRA